MADDKNELLERLNFSEEEPIRVISTNRNEVNTQGYEAWAVGKIMAKEKINREAMQVAIDVGKAIGEVVAIDWRDREG
ncbi:hypothetical protein Goarm_020707, partial [Gossypium armourianum]|nr:hypothetical protein [Gossypium armourianum]